MSNTFLESRRPRELRPSNTQYLGLALSLLVNITLTTWTNHAAASSIPGHFEVTATAMNQGFGSVDSIPVQVEMPEVCESRGRFTACGASSATTTAFPSAEAFASVRVTITAGDPERPLDARAGGAAIASYGVSANSAAWAALPNIRYDIPITLEPSWALRTSADTIGGNCCAGGFAEVALFLNDAIAFSASRSGALVNVSDTEKIPSTVSCFLTVCSSVQIMLRASAGATALKRSDATFLIGSAMAFIDPIITIDPTYEYASYFYLTVSPGIASPGGVVPLPPALPLFLGAVALLFGARTRRRGVKSAMRLPDRHQRLTDSC